MATALRNLMNRFSNLLNNTNMVALRVWVTMLCVIGTTVGYVFVSPHYDADWSPSWEFLMFLAMLAGIDVAAFAVKRLTHVADDGEAVGQKIRAAKETKETKEHNPIPPQDEGATSDLSDLDERG